MPVTHSPIVRRRRLGNELRRLREAAGLTGEEVVRRLGWASASKLSRLENGRSRPDPDDVLDLLDLYAAGPAVRKELVAITRDAGDVQRWLRSYPVMTRRQRGYAELETGSARIHEYGGLLVPGLLQTPEYAGLRILSCRPLLPAAGPPNGRHGDTVEAEVAARLARQSVLTREPPPAYVAVLEEAALSGRCGSPRVVRGQVARLVELAALPNVTLQVLPRDATVAGWYVPHTAFSIYRYAQPQDPSALAIEGLTSDLVITADAELDRYAVIFDWLRAAALSPEDTVAWLVDAADRWATGETAGRQGAGETAGRQGVGEAAGRSDTRPDAVEMTEGSAADVPAERRAGAGPGVPPQQHGPRPVGRRSGSGRSAGRPSADRATVGRATVDRRPQYPDADCSQETA